METIILYFTNSCIHSIIYSFNQYSSSTYQMSGTALNTGNMIMNQRGMVHILLELTVSQERNRVNTPYYGDIRI